jgi:hypothetical protein
MPALAQNYGMLASPPPLQVVVARAFISCALTMRAQLEQHDDAAAIPALLKQAVDWLNEHGFARLLGDEETAALCCAPGALDPVLQQRYALLGEAAAVLAWALRRSSLPAPDVAVDAADIAASLGFLSDHGAALATTARLRDRDETARYADIAGALHWRIQRQMTEPAPLLMHHWRSDQLAWPDAVAPAQFVDDDLALGGMAVSALANQALLPWLLQAAERHRAALWLLGQNRDYWQVAASVS